MKETRSATASRLSFDSAHFDGDEYNRTAQRARLEEVRLVESVYKVRPELFMDEEQEARPTKQGFSGGMVGHHIEVARGIVVGGYAWEADIRIARKKALSIKATYMLAYSGVEECDPEYIRLYFQKIARFTTYPFFRAHFAMQTSSSSLSLPPLPSLVERVD